MQDTRADRTQAVCLIERVEADYLPGDRGYENDEIIEQAEKQAMETVISPKKMHHRVLSRIPLSSSKEGNTQI